MPVFDECSALVLVILIHEVHKRMDLPFHISNSYKAFQLFVGQYLIALPCAHSTRQQHTAGLALAILLSPYKAGIGET